MNRRILPAGAAVAPAGPANRAGPAVPALVAVLALVAAFAAGGCARRPAAPPPPSSAAVTWERLAPERLPSGLRDWFERNRRVRGTHVRHEGDRSYVLVAWGEKPTGGYAVRVTDVVRGPRSSVVLVSLSAPEPGQVVTEALTHPFDLVSAERLREPVTFAYQGRYTLASPSVVTPPDRPPDVPPGSEARFQVVQPAFGSVIRSPVRVAGRASVFEAEFDIEIEDGHNVLATQHVVAAGGAPEWGEFDVTIPFEQPTNPYGMIIFVTYSAKDGSRQEHLLAPVRFER